LEGEVEGRIEQAPPARELELGLVGDAGAVAARREPDLVDGGERRVAADQHQPVRRLVVGDLVDEGQLAPQKRGHHPEAAADADGPGVEPLRSHDARVPLGGVVEGREVLEGLGRRQGEIDHVDEAGHGILRRGRALPETASAGHFCQYFFLTYPATDLDSEADQEACQSMPDEKLDRNTSPHGAIPLGKGLERTLSLGAVVRLTGLSEHTLRAWERRHRAVVPLRTPRGTRRYREADVRRLRLLRDAVEAGHRIGDLASLPDEELVSLSPRALQEEPVRSPALATTLRALADLDVEAAHREVAGQLAALGPRRFVDEFATPLLHAVGDAWERDAFCIASEHLASAMVRSALDASLRALPEPDRGPRVVFATLPGERHELGLLVAALVARSAGAAPSTWASTSPSTRSPSPWRAAAPTSWRSRACSSSRRRPLREIAALRDALPSDVDIWIGGPVRFEPPLGTSTFDDLPAFEARIRWLVTHGPGDPS
jgi:MerR family transcriptional regulator, light-induced transcriptional regulator